MQCQTEEISILNFHPLIPIIVIIRLFKLLLIGLNLTSNVQLIKDTNAIMKAATTIPKEDAAKASASSNSVKTDFATNTLKPLTKLMYANYVNLYMNRDVNTANTLPTVLF